MWSILGLYVLVRLVLRLLPLALAFALGDAILHGELRGGLLAAVAVLGAIPFAKRGARRRLF